MPDSSNTTTLNPSNADLLALASRLRDGADNMIANRQLAADLRAAADVASRWANIGRGWDDPDISGAAIHELDDRLIIACDGGDDSPAVETTDVFLAWRVIDCVLSPWILRLRQLPNAPENIDVRGTISMMLSAIDVEPHTAEEIEAIVSHVPPKPVRS
jgi:hypothetical protein